SRSPAGPPSPARISRRRTQRQKTRQNARQFRPLSLHRRPQPAHPRHRKKIPRRSRFRQPTHRFGSTSNRETQHRPFANRHLRRIRHRRRQPALHPPRHDRQRLLFHHFSANAFHPRLPPPHPLFPAGVHSRGAGRRLRNGNPLADFLHHLTRGGSGRGGTRRAGHRLHRPLSAALSPGD